QQAYTPEDDTWNFPRDAGTFHQRAGFHGSQRPEQLLARIIRACSNEHDVVLDPFSGSATTLAVARKLNRRFLGCELSAEYAAQGTKRLESILPGDALVGAPEPQVSAPPTPDQPKARTRTARKKKSVPEQRSLLPE
ncbi:MAG: DNA methyltransferase, partial [Phycisphaerae bacterium]